MKTTIQKSSTLFFLSLLSAGLLLAQTSLEQARQAYANGAYDSAITIYTSQTLDLNAQLELLHIYWKAGELQKSLDGINGLLTNSISLEDRIDAYLLKGKVLFSLGQPLESVMLMDSLLPHIQQANALAEAYNIKSKSLIWAGETAQGVAANGVADSIYATADLEDPILLGNINNVDGILSYFNGNFDQAIEKFEAAIEAKKQVLSTTHPDVISLFGNTGVMYKSKLEYDKALQYYGYELENYAKSIGEDHLDVGTSYQNIGSIYISKSEYDLALQAMKKALYIREKKLGAKNPLTLDIYEWIGNIQAAQGDFKTAKETFTKVRDGRIEELGEQSHFVSLAYFNIAEAEFKLGNPSSALENFSKAAAIGRLVYSEKNYDQASNYNGIALSLNELGEYNEARKNYFQALEESIPGFEWDGDPTSPPEVDNYLRMHEVFASLIGLANSYQETNKEADLIIALRFIQTARDLLEAHKRNFTIKSDKITISQSAKELADLAIVINHKLFLLKNDEAFLAHIFDWSEYVKGTTLLSTLSDSQAKKIANIPYALLEKELSFRLKKDSIKTQWASGERNLDLNTQLLHIEKEHADFIKQLEQDYPTYSEAKFGLKPMSIEEITQTINSPKKAILQYFVSKTNALFVSIIRENEHIVISSNYDNISDDIIALRNSLSSIDVDAFTKSAQSIYHSVIEPVSAYLSGIDQLVIIPDGMLGYVPFELLIDGDGQYLFEKYVMQYDLSSTLAARQNGGASIAPNLLAYAPSFKDEIGKGSNQLGLIRSEMLTSLPGAIDEVNSVINVLGGEARVGDVATEALFRSEAANYDILHLATHSIINESDPSFTKLIFSEGEEQDSQLHIYELENIELNAKLVTLSACNTGVGKIAAGEGVMSLARSFRSIGVPSVVMSLWPASDKSTPELMTYFYQNLKDGQTKDLALNNARKQYLANATGKARHPFYWGGFVLIGDNSPLENDRNLLVYLIPSVLVIVMILTLYRRKKNAKVDPTISSR